MTASEVLELGQPGVEMRASATNGRQIQLLRNARTVGDWTAPFLVIRKGMMDALGRRCLGLVVDPFAPAALRDGLAEFPRHVRVSKDGGHFAGFREEQGFQLVQLK